MRWQAPELDAGITRGRGGYTRMQRLVGCRDSQEIDLLAYACNGAKAEGLGPVSHVVEPGDREEKIADPRIACLRGSVTQSGGRRVSGFKSGTGGSDPKMRDPATGVSSSIMSAPARSMRASVLLAALLAMPAWSLVHAAGHHHLASHHRGEAPHSHDPASQAAGHPDGDHPAPSARGPRGQDHEHDHPVVVFVRSTHNTDLPAPTAPPSATPRLEVAQPERWALDLQTAPARAAPDGTGPFNPRAPPIA